MSEVRQEVLIEAPPEVVWGLITDVDRHQEWWPDMIDVECEGLEAGCDYRMVERMPAWNAERRLLVEELDDCSKFRIRCLNTGTFVDFTLTEARGNTFVEGSAGMNPASLRYRVVDAITGRRYFTRWLQRSLEAMKQIATTRAAAASRTTPS
jgi:Polyketide cyclase / dehydrase and lipid transport